MIKLFSSFPPKLRIHALLGISWIPGLRYAAPGMTVASVRSAEKLDHRILGSNPCFLQIHREAPLPYRLFLSSLTGLGTHWRPNPGNKLPRYCLSSLTGLYDQETGYAPALLYGTRERPPGAPTPERGNERGEVRSPHPISPSPPTPPRPPSRPPPPCPRFGRTRCTRPGRIRRGGRRRGFRRRLLRRRTVRG